MLTIPANLEPGTYYLMALADLNEQYVETDEANNTATGSILTIVKVVDLVVSNLTTTATSLYPRDTFDVHIEVTNQGSSTVSASRTGIYLSTDAVIDVSDRRINRVTVGTIEPAGTYVLDATISVPRSMPPGTYYLGAMADDTEYHDETDETNNALTGPQLIILN